MNDPLNLDLNNTQTAAPTSKGERRYLLQHQADQDYVLQIDNTSLETFNTCPRSAYYRLVVGRVGPPRVALTYGGAIHNGLEYWYKERATTERQPDEIQADAIEVALATFDDITIPFGEWRTPERCQDTLRRYWAKYPTESWTLLDNPIFQGCDNPEPAVEIPFSIPLGVVSLNEWVTDLAFNPIVEDEELRQDDENDEIPTRFVKRVYIYWTGKIDLAVRVNDAIRVVDHKTSSVQGKDFWDAFVLSNQMQGYAWAGQQIFDQPVSGAYINCIYGRSPAKTAAGLKSQHEKMFSRRFYPYSQERINEWEQNTMVLVSDFLADLARNYFPMKTAWCCGKYGKCPYHEVCDFDNEEERAHFIYSDNYTDNTWTPLDK